MFSIPYYVERSITINRNVAGTFKLVADFASWPQWSPWLSQEPACPTTIEGTGGTVGHSQSWEGDFIGSGKIQIATLQLNDFIDYDLEFYKPWKSKSKSGFRFASAGENTEITWWMEGKLPFFMFFMKNMMTSWIGMDYDRGLSMLKELLESGTVSSETTVKGVVDRAPMFYLGKRRSCAIADVGPAMKEDFAEMGRLLENSQLSAPKQVFSVYHKYAMGKGICEYTSGYLYDSPQNAPTGVVAGQLPAHRAVQVDHRGPYRYLGSAWSAAMGYSQSKHKRNKALPMYEIYPNNPNEVAEVDVLTEIYAPIK